MGEVPMTEGAVVCTFRFLCFFVLARIALYIQIDLHACLLVFS